MSGRPATLHEGFEVVIMIAIADRRDAWVELSSRPQRLTASLGWNAQTIQESEMALFYECMLQCARKVLDAADIVRDGDFSPTALDTVLSTPANNRLFIAFHFPGLKEAKNAEAYRAIAAGCVPNDDFIKGG